MHPFQSRVTSYNMFSNMLSGLGLNSLENGNLSLSVAGSNHSVRDLIIKICFLIVRISYLAQDHYFLSLYTEFHRD